MAEIEFEDLELRVTRVLRNGHRRYDVASKERLVSACLREHRKVRGNLAIKSLGWSGSPALSISRSGGCPALCGTLHWRPP